MFSYYSMIPICLITGDINIDHLWWCLSGFSIVKSPFFLLHLRNIWGGYILRNADILSLILHSFSFSIHWWFLLVILSIIVLAKWWFFYFHHFFYIYLLKYTMRKSCPFCICTYSVIKFLSLCPYFSPHMGHHYLYYFSQPVRFAVGSFFQLALCPVTNFHYFVITFLLSGGARCSRLTFSYPCANPEICFFFRDFWFLFWRLYSEIKIWLIGGDLATVVSFASKYL